MGRRGPKPTPNKIKLIRGTFQNQTATTELVPPLEGEPGKPPRFLNASARRLWADHLATYRRRGQNVAGCEPALAQYVALEAELERRYKVRLEIPTAMITAYRMLACEFFDTPASQIGKGKTATPANRFTKNAAGGAK
jgi:hypothetical protein